MCNTGWSGGASRVHAEELDVAMWDTQVRDASYRRMAPSGPIARPARSARLDACRSPSQYVACRRSGRNPCARTEA
jgi:hypothetical protein